MKKILTFSAVLLAAAGAQAQTQSVGIGTITPLVKLDVVGDTMGLRDATNSYNNLWLNISGTTNAYINASGTTNGLGFRVGNNTTGTYGDGQTLSTVATMSPDGGMGIGTTTPNGRLVVSQAGATGVDTAAAIYGFANGAVSAKKGGIFGTYTGTTNGVGVQGMASNGTPFANAGTVFPILGATPDAGVYGTSTATNAQGVLGTSTNGFGVMGLGQSLAGVLGYTTATGQGGVTAFGNTQAIFASAATFSGATAPTVRFGVFAQSSGATSTNYGAYSTIVTPIAGTVNIATRGSNTAANTAGANYGLYGDVSGATSGNYAVRAIAAGTGTSNYGVYATNTGTATNNYGTYGSATGAGTGTNYGVYGAASGATTNNWAGYFLGNVNITGSIAKASGTFKIDHPLDPENKYLYHSFVESPDMMNVYNGNITTDAQGFATVTLPDYFEALNKDFRYQLTSIGTFAQAIIKDKVKGNSFRIQTSQPNVEVSWQVTGIRKDAYANAHRVVPEVDKEAENKGHYIHPAEWGQPATKGIDYQVEQERSLAPVPALANELRPAKR